MLWGDLLTVILDDSLEVIGGQISEGSFEWRAVLVGEDDARVDHVIVQDLKSKSSFSVIGSQRLVRMSFPVKKLKMSIISCSQTVKTIDVVSVL